MFFCQYLADETASVKEVKLLLDQTFKERSPTEQFKWDLWLVSREV